jgi:hypothetical protein
MQFKRLEYFGFTELINKSVVQKVVEEKLKGKFKIKIRNDLPEPLRIA